MAEDDGEIEYLDEDEEVIQQYVSTVQTPIIQDVRSVAPQANTNTESQANQVLLVERKRTEKRKLKVEEDDSDYDPNDDLDYLAEQRKKRKMPSKKIQHKVSTVVQSSQPKKILNYSLKTYENKPHNLPGLKTYENKLRNLPNLTVRKEQSVKQPSTVKSAFKPRQMQKYPAYDLSMRKKMDIRIPDYQDPICMPVLAILRGDNDLSKLENWNKLCMQQLKKPDLKHDAGNTVSSAKTFVFRNVKNRSTGRIETTIWGKNTIENEEKIKKSETFQTLLPRYREKKIVKPYTLLSGNNNGINTKHTYEAVLTKEEYKDEETLVVYKPKDNLSAVYKYAKVEKKNDDTEQETNEHKRVLREVACCKVCAACYQSSWRGIRRKNSNDSVKCHVCKRSFVSVYNLLTHLKNNHTAQDVRRHKRALSRTLASMVDYHYKCRICQEQFMSISHLKKHVPKHRGIEIFNCEVGSHLTL